MKIRATLTAVVFLSLFGLTLAHATLVRGALVSEPEAPQPDVPVTLRLGLLDPSETPVEDAVVVARFTQQGDDRIALEASFTETADAGIYLSSPVVFPEAGRYRLLLRDQTYRQEEARAELNFEVGGETPKRSYIFVFPPTETGDVNVGRWLLRVGSSAASCRRCCDTLGTAESDEKGVYAKNPNVKVVSTER